MKNPTQNKLFSILDRCLVQPLAWVLCKQQRFTNWLMAKGLSAKLAKLVLMVVNLMILALFLLILLPSWIVVGIAVLMAIAFFGVDIDLPEPQKEEWRMGSSGWGLYRGDECIIWSDDPNDPNE